MNRFKRFLLFFIIIISAIAITSTSWAQYTYENGQPRGPGDKSYIKLHYGFGVGGAYFAKRGGLDLKGYIGAYTQLQFRFSRALGAGMYTQYGYLIGRGSQYWSAFNPCIFFYPMMYKNPKFEPYIIVGGNAIDMIIGTSTYDNLGMGQGVFGGLGVRFHPGSLLGFEFQVTGGPLWMQRPTGQSGRAMTIPIYARFGITY